MAIDVLILILCDFFMEVSELHIMAAIVCLFLYENIEKNTPETKPCQYHGYLIGMNGVKLPIAGNSPDPVGVDNRVRNKKLKANKDTVFISPQGSTLSDLNCNY